MLVKRDGTEVLINRENNKAEMRKCWIDRDDFLNSSQLGAQLNELVSGDDFFSLPSPSGDGEIHQS